MTFLRNKVSLFSSNILLSPYDFSASKSSHYLNKNNGTGIIVQKGYQGFYVWSQIKDNIWAQLDFRTDGVSRSSLYNQILTRIFNVYGVAQDATRSGTWTERDTSTTGQNSSYVTNRALSSSTNGSYLEVTITGTEFWVSYTNRTNGRYIKVYIDDDPDAANDLPSNGSFRYIDTYGSIDNLRNRYVKIASNLENVSHTIKLEVVSDYNDSGNGSNGVFIESVLVPGSPSDEKSFPSAFPLNTSVSKGDEYLGSNGYFYVCSTAGTTDASTQPSHTSGAAVNGTAQFRAYGETSYQLRKQNIGFPSEHEMATFVTINSVTEDFGGQTHGDADGVETSSSSTLELDESIIDLSSMNNHEFTSTGSSLVLTDTITWAHTEEEALANISMVRTLTPGKYQVESTIDWNASADVGAHYPAMLPFVRYDLTSDQDIFDTIKFDNGRTIVLDDYESESGDPEVSGGNKYGVVIAGKWLRDSENLDLYRHCYTTNSAVDDYNRTGSESFARVNRNASDGSSSTWQSKVYFARSDASNLISVTSEDIWYQDTVYVWALE